MRAFPILQSGWMARKEEGSGNRSDKNDHFLAGKASIEYNIKILLQGMLDA
jgi:hypothetical protein